MGRNDKADAASAISSIILTLEQFDDDTRGRILNSVAGYFGTTPAPLVSIRPIHEALGIESVSRSGFAKDNAPSPKVFLMEKQPRTDVERIACLAYYLAHYRDMPQFKTLDLGKLNTEAAQPKFSNAANAANNAQKMGYLVPGTKGQRQLSGAGERFVGALPDRAAAREAMNNAMLRRKTKKPR